MPIKILILENRFVDFTDISIPIINKFKGAVEVFPKAEGETGDIQYFHYFLEEFLQLAKFHEVVEYYNDIDVFIIDINLLNDTDSLGTRFYNYLIETKYRNRDFKVIEVSSGPSEIKGKNCWYISKIHDRLYFNRIVDLIADLYPELQTEIKASPENKKSVHTTFEHGVADGIDKGFEKINKWTRYILHVVITMAFYVLMFGGICFATYMIADSFIELGKNYREHVKYESAAHAAEKISSNADTSQLGITGDTQEIKDKEAQKKWEMEIFKPAENIFFYLLPIFIIFGFYNYYKTNSAIYLLDGNVSKIDEIRDKASIRSINQTKMIFISSIISYVLVKCTEVIFYGDCENPYRLAAGGVLLLMLMGYFIMMYKKEH